MNEESVCGKRGGKERCAFVDKTSDGNDNTAIKREESERRCGVEYLKLRTLFSPRSREKLRLSRNRSF